MQEYLKFHTKDQIIALAKEIGLSRHLEKSGIENWEKAKKDELIGYFFNNEFDLKGNVPKLMKVAR